MMPPRGPALQRKEEKIEHIIDCQNEQVSLPNISHLRVAFDAYYRCLIQHAMWMAFLTPRLNH
jgi:hypothetical protein